MSIVRSWLRRLERASHVFSALRRASGLTARQGAGTAALIVAVGLAAASAWHFAADDMLGDALAPLGFFSDSAQDDGAGDASSAAADAERYLSVPAPLDDERVIAALGPIANLACNKSDYADRSTNA